MSMLQFIAPDGDRMVRRDLRRPLLFYGIVTTVVGVCVGILLGRFAFCPAEDPPTKVAKNGTFLPGIPDSIIKDGDPGITARLMNEISNRNIEEFLKHITSKPHVAGSENSLDLAKWTQAKWKEWGFDDVKLTPYDVLLSFPDANNPNVVRVLDDVGGVVYESPLREANLTGEDDPTALPPYNAYSPAGLIQGDMVYVNYGRVEDYNWLKNHTNINVTGKIVIAKYGRIFRGSLVEIAADHGATGVIIYSDPKDYTQSDTGVYPDSLFLPPSGAQRGTIYEDYGDPLTPGYPATKSAYRYSEDSPNVKLPRIPAHPIGYGIAEKILAEMGGQEVPPDWRGGINITYRLGPELRSTGWKIQINISTTNVIKTVHNVIGTIKGAIEPDRYVLIGNHRDAWVYGATDPGSGTAVMMEVARVMGNMAKAGIWRPRRSVLFCSWAAEEYALIGSNEWAEEYRKVLRERAVAYINLDTVVTGNYSLRAGATPLMYRAVYEAAKKVPNPNHTDTDHPTLYDNWLLKMEWADEDGNNLNIPRIGSLGSGSDYATLVQLTGIASVDLGYKMDNSKGRVKFFALYHTIYETFYAVKHFIDPNFECHRAISRLSAELIRSLADSLIIPFNVSDYSWALNKYWRTLDTEHGAKLRDNLDNYDELKDAISNFTRESQRFKERLSSLNKFDPLATRAVNDQLLLLEKAFLDDEGLPGRPTRKHLIVAESSKNAYAGSSFPGLVDLLFEIATDPDVDARWTRVKQHFSVLLFTIQSAASTLSDVTRFMPVIE
ncbi:N-acetylated-alpha-linked acidic dipeptidase 2-like [Haliotis rufescens]|uniref:N-acetylated-alpha-linked acidic dipeptidase 2-like n=1 Tax=Haliotis rufescens TaxID=6454 RepID=UPI00201F3A24|nr:N-acetylated-alpha-linked acidic dipeptidase 2-like [Haliotis rufescens]XP_048259626.1 N-acetylated-alpha-linked acidic dipeptidase 2-like [Haliotis rufescens]